MLDVGCGAGANIFWLRKSFPEWEFIGIDIDNDAINMAREINKEDKKTRFETMDFFKTPFPAKSFDYVFAIQFLPSVNFDFHLFLKEAFKLAKEGVFITALFSDGWIEQHSVAYDLKEKWRGIYKIYSLERFKNAINDLAEVNELELEKFEIDAELPRPDRPMFGTYTEKTEDKRILQISGYMLMPWYNILINLKKRSYFKQL
jgi:ubiquinone/menaquinone biosynthesis C-methylase UbiE